MTFELTSHSGRVRKLVQFDNADVMLLFNYRWHLAKRNARTYYALARLDNTRTTYMHQLILPVEKGLVVDHINGDGLDNRRCNLRSATIALNLRNQPARQGRVTKFKGVSLDHRPLRKRWCANLNRGNGKSYLGRFETEIEAAIAYNHAAKEHFGEYAWLNPIPQESKDEVS